MAKKASSNKKAGKKSGDAVVLPLHQPSAPPLLSRVVQMAAEMTEEPARGRRVTPGVIDDLAARFRSLIDETVALLGPEEAPKFMMKSFAVGLGIDEKSYVEFVDSLESISSTSEPAMELYRLKVTLADAPCKISRTIEVPDCSLGYLHQVLQIAMGWTDSHLHHFQVAKEFYGPMFEDDGGMPVEWEDESSILLSDVSWHFKKKKFTYLYDFGDSWEHQIEIVSRTMIDKRPPCATCIEGTGACPPEDVGGVWGYGEILERLKSGQLDEELDLLPEDFDPNQVDLADTSRALKKLKWKDYH